MNFGISSGFLIFFLFPWNNTDLFRAQNFLAYCNFESIEKRVHISLVLLSNSTTEHFDLMTLKKHFITLGGYIFLGQMVSVGNYRGVVSSRDKIFYVGPSTHTWGYGKFVNARYARFTNSNAKLRLRLRLHLDFLPSLRSGKKPAIRPCSFIRPYIN